MAFTTFKAVGQFHGLVILMVHPCSVVHRAEVLGDLFHAATARIVHADVRDRRSNCSYFRWKIGCTGVSALRLKNS